MLALFGAFVFAFVLYKVADNVRNATETSLNTQTSSVNLLLLMTCATNIE